MSVSFDGWIADVVVASAGTRSRTVSGKDEYSDATAITIQSPATLDGGTWLLRVSQDGSTFAVLNDGTADIGPPGAGKARQYTELLGFKFWEIYNASGTAADRTFKVSKQWTV